MTSSLLRPVSQLSPAAALELSRQAPKIIESSPGAVSTSALQSLFSAPETPELWTIYEHLLISCLRTGDDEAAHICLGRLVNRFGDDNERIMAFLGLLKEAEAEDEGTLEAVLKEYETILRNNPTNIPIAKRRVALLRSLGRLPDAITALNALLDFTPTDSEAWSELADMYFSQGLYSQAIFALEEILVFQPNAWNIHARLGEMLLMAAKTSSQQNESSKQLSEAIKRFCRSVELCDDYLRGYYGLKLATKQALSEPRKTNRQADIDGLSLPDSATTEKLDALATEKLAEIVRRFSAGERGWQGYDESEVAAARELLDKETSVKAR